MKKYVDVDKFAERICNFHQIDEDAANKMIWLLRTFPTAKVTEVVRCKDCEHCHTSIDPKTQISIRVCGYVGYNPAQSSQVESDDYCSHGERRQESGA